MGKGISRLKGSAKERAGNLKQNTKFLLSEANKDFRLIALVLVELVISIVIAVGIFVYLDPGVNLVPFPYNIVGFAVLLALFLWVFSMTKEFSVAKGMKKKWF